MSKASLYVKSLVNVVLYVVILTLVIIFLPKLFVFFMPFVIGWLVSAIANPAVKLFEEKIKFKRKASSAVMIVLILAVIISLGYGIMVFLVNQGIGFVSSLPDKWNDWQNTLDNFGNDFNKLFKNLPKELREPFNDFGKSIKEWLYSFIAGIGSGEKTDSVIASISSGIGNAANVLIGIIMGVLSAYFFTVEHNSIASSLEKKVSESVYTKINAAYRGLKKAIGGYFKAQLQIELFVYVITVVGLLILRVDYAVIIALGIAFLDFLPFFGAGIIMVPWAIIGFANENYFLGIGMFITWGVGQLVRQLIQPRFVGANVGFKPLPTLILLFLGFKWKGVFGMVIAVPIAMIFVALYEEKVFETFIRSVKILWSGFQEFRKLPKED